MLEIGNQLKAARALAGVSQADVANAAGVFVTTIGNMEKAGPDSIGGRVDTIRRVQAALEAMGVEFIDKNGGGAGVRLKHATPPAKKRGKGK